MTSVLFTLGRCVTAEARYECRKLGLSSGFAWNLLRALLLLLGLTIGLPVLLPWVQSQLPSYGLMSEAQYEVRVRVRVRVRVG